MKVGILTFPHAPSLGAMLQMGALYHTIQSQGHDVEIINYVGSNVNHRRTQPITAKTLVIKAVAPLLGKGCEPSFRRFEKAFKMFPEEVTASTETLREISNRYDRIIVGSDQVWNHIVTGNDLNFYLAFCDDNSKKAAYAASFGNTQVIEESQSKIAELLKQFSYLGVREKQGQKIVYDLTGREASVVLDPTLLVTRDYLLDQLIPNNRKHKYVLFFCIKPSPALQKRAEDYAKENGLELVTIGGRMRDRFLPDKHPIFDAGPGEFLGLIKDAQCVFTNSFHGLALSIALQTDFYVEYSTDTNSRLVNLVEMLDLQDRVVTAQPLWPTKIDYDAVEEKLHIQREFSHAFLHEILVQK